MKKFGRTVLLALVLFPLGAFAQDSAEPVDLDGDGYSDAMRIQSPTGPVLFKLNDGTVGTKALTDACPTKIGSGWLWKPASQDSGGRREGKPMILFDRNQPGKSSLNVYAGNGTKICSMAKWNSERYYMGTGCGKTASQLKNLAKNANGGVSTIYVQGKTGKCYGAISDPTKRTDKR